MASSNFRRSAPAVSFKLASWFLQTAAKMLKKKKKKNLI
jgi:hypothetical protein